MRQTVLLWFTSISKDNLEYLDNKDSETWSQIVAYHKDMIPCKKSPSGRTSVVYQNGPPFHTAILLQSISHIGNVLVGRQQWGSPQVLTQLRVLLGSNNAATKELVSAIQKNILGAYEEAWEELEAIERETY